MKVSAAEDAAVAAKKGGPGRVVLSAQSARRARRILDVRWLLRKLLASELLQVSQGSDASKR